MTRSSSPSRRIRTCVPCSKVKARCYFQPVNVDRHVCDRCDRLGINCQPQALSWLRRPRRIKEPESYELVGDVHRVKPVGLQGVSGYLSSSEGRRASDGDVRELLSRQPDTAAVLDALSWSQAERVLGSFRDRFMPNFPFVVVEEKITAQQLHQSKPFLFRAIMLVAATVPPSQAEKMERELLSDFGLHLLVEDSRSLDSLQGLLVYIAWSGSKSLHDRQITTLVHLALGYAHTLGITESLKQGRCSLEQQRAYLGSFYVLSTHSVYFGRRNPLSSQHVDYCCETLLNARELPSDILLERLVRMTQLSERLFVTFGSPQSPERKKAGFASVVQVETEGFRIEIDGLIESVAFEQLRSQFDDFSTSTSQTSLDLRARYLTLNAYYLLVRLFEPGVCLDETTEDSTVKDITLQRRYMSFLKAVISFLDILISFSGESYLCQPISWWAHVTSVISIAKRLAPPDSEDWRARLSDKGSLLSGRFYEASSAWRDQIVAFAKETGIEVTDGDLNTPNQFENYARKMLLEKSWLKRVPKVEKAEEEVAEESSDEVMSTSNSSIGSFGETLPGGWPSA